MTELRIGVIGCGGIVRNVHVKNFNSLARFKVVACMDIFEKAAEEVAKACGAEYYTTDLDRVLNDKSINAVLIATLAETHAEISIKAARAGKAIFLEKPVGDTLENCLSLKKVLDETRVPFMVGYCYRFNSAVQHAFGHFVPDYSLAHIMTSGELKTVMHNHINNYCHAVDLARFFHKSDPVSVAVTGNGAPMSLDKAVGKLVANIHFENGSLATIVTGSDCISPNFGKWFYKYCDSNGNVAEILNYRKSVVSGAVSSTFADEGSYHSGHRKELELFIAAVLDGQPMPVTFDDGLWVNAVMDATKLSFESGREVYIKEIWGALR